jgi:hypothetical protein
VNRTAATRAAIVIAALVILWRIIAVNAVAYDQNGRPQLPQGARGELLEGLRQNPAEVRLLLALARADAVAGEDARAKAQLAAATAMAPIERQALGAEAEALLREGRMGDAAQRLSRIATLYGGHERIFPVFGRMLAADEASFLRVAASNPRWLGAFLQEQCRQSADPLQLARLLQLRRTATTQPDAAEVECVTERLRGAGRWTEAYQAWINTLPRERLAEVGYVFNGSFEYPASGAGFDWKPDRTPERDSGHAVEFAPSREGRGARVLRVGYTGKRQVTSALVQYLALPPGRYVFRGSGRADRLSGQRGVQWVLRCASAEARDPIASSERFVGSSEWRNFEFAVDISPRCAGQVLALEAVDMARGTTFLSGNAWFDDLALVARR